MNDNIIASVFSYRVSYIPKGARKQRHTSINGVARVKIEEIDPSDAPVAYHVFEKDRSNGTFEILIHGDALLWPVLENGRPLSQERFVALAADDWQSASAVLDPIGRTYRGAALSYDGYFARKPIRSEGYENLRACQMISAERDASKLVFCGGMVFVDAGEPVWYAVSQPHLRDGFDLIVGASSFDRRDKDGFTIPGANHWLRTMAARRSRAFGLQEIGGAFAWLQSHDIRYVSTIQPPGAHEGGPAATVCAEALSRHLWEQAGTLPSLRKQIPLLADAREWSAPPIDLAHQQVLEQFVALVNREQHPPLPFLLQDVEAILARLARLGADLDDDDDDAIGSLKP